MYCIQDSFLSVLVNSWIILLFTGLGVVFVFDPLGNPRPQPAAMEPLGVREEGTQLFSTARSLAVKVWESRLRLLCCLGCLPQDESHRAAFSSIAQLVSGFFSVSVPLCLLAVAFFCTFSLWVCIVTSVRCYDKTCSSVGPIRKCGQILQM